MDVSLFDSSGHMLQVNCRQLPPSGWSFCWVLQFGARFEHVIVGKFVIECCNAIISAQAVTFCFLETLALPHFLLGPMPWCHDIGFSESSRRNWTSMTFDRSTKDKWLAATWHNWMLRQTPQVQPTSLLCFGMKKLPCLPEETAKCGCAWQAKTVSQRFC